MSRDGKGTSVQKYVSDYCVVDLETTGVYVGYSKIIEISAIKVRNSIVVDEFSSLINPLCRIPPEATAVNNITDDMVKDAPTIDMVIDDFVRFVGDDVILGHNNAGFDMNILYDVIEEFNGDYFSNNYIDLLHCARRCLTDLDNCKLETISKHYGLDTTGEHRALKDCYLTKECYDKMYEEFGDEPFRRSSRGSSERSFRLTSETIALRELQSLLELIIEDNKVTLEEFNTLKAWMENHTDLRGNYPFDKIMAALEKVLEDGVVTPEELEELYFLFSEYVDPVKSQSKQEIINSISGKHICITGDFNYGERKSVIELFTKAGGIIDNGVKKSTDYVVVGSNGSANWRTGNYGTKIQKALQYIDKGINITIIEEENFIPQIKNIVEMGLK